MPVINSMVKHHHQINKQLKSIKPMLGKLSLNFNERNVILNVGDFSEPTLYMTKCSDSIIVETEINWGRSMFEQLWEITKCPGQQLYYIKNMENM